METATTLLRVLADARSALSLTDISERAGLAPAKAHRYLLSLGESGMVDHIRTGRYALGELSARIGLAAAARIDPIEAVARRMPELVEETGLAAVLSVLGPSRPVVTRFERAAGSTTPAIGVGTEVSIIGTATGKAFAAHLPDDVLHRMIALEYGHEEFDVLAVKPVPHPQRVYAANRPIFPNCATIATPIFSLSGQPIAALALMSRDDATVAEGGPVWNALAGIVDHTDTNGL